MKARSPDRLKRFFAAIAVVATGTTLRLTGYEAGPPYGLVKYGGSLLWGVMVYLLVAVILPRRRGAAARANLLRLEHRRLPGRVRRRRSDRPCLSASPPIVPTQKSRVIAHPAF